MKIRHDCTADAPCGDYRYSTHCDGCEKDLTGLYPVPPKQGILQLTNPSRGGEWTEWCRPCAVKLLPAALLPEEWRPDPSDGPSHVWLGDLSGWTLEGGEHGTVILEHRCGWREVAETPMPYAANIVQRIMEVRAHDCRKVER